MKLLGKISAHFVKNQEKKNAFPDKAQKTLDNSIHAVPWEKNIPPEKRRYYVHEIHGGPGKSGMGSTLLCAYDKEQEFPVAIKTFQDKFLLNLQSVERFKREAEVWIELGKHNNIVGAFWVEINLGRPYVFMEWVVGDESYGADLSKWIWRRGFEPPLMLNFAIQFCRGMGHAERCFKEMGRAFVHRDIKPANIMVLEKENGCLNQGLNWSDQRITLTVFYNYVAPIVVSYGCIYGAKYREVKNGNLGKNHKVFGKIERNLRRCRSLFTTRKNSI
jgi:serine/threonine protein kinase